MNMRGKNKGFSLLEVLIAIVILSFGLLAVAALQGRLLRNTSDTNARTVAMNIGHGVIDRFRSILSVATDLATSDPTLASGDFDYGDIATGDLSDIAVLGGDGSATTVTIGNTIFTPTWTVTDCWRDGAGSFDCTGATADDGAPDFKKLAVTVAWDDEAGDTQSIVLEEIFARVGPADSGILLDDFTLGGQRPTVAYTPQPAPEVVKVPTLGTSEGRFKETSKPEPDVLRNDFSTITTFSTITFEENADSTFSAVRQEEFFVINCVCQYDATTGTGRAPTVWDGEEFEEGLEVTKQTGSAADSFITGQPVLCDDCCRDHHDDLSNSDIEHLYDPFRPDGSVMPETSDYSSNNHNHYFPNEEGDLVAATPGAPADFSLAVSTDADGNPVSEPTSAYLESCRFARTDGRLFVSQDFHMEVFNVLPSTQLQTDAGLSSYQSYISDFVTDYVDAIASMSDYPQTTPDTTDTSLFTNQFSPDSVSSADLPEQFLGRAIYIDYLYPDLLECIQQRRGVVATTDDTDSNCFPATTATGGGFLDITPFFEINVTSLSNWSAEGDVSVTDDPLADDTEDTFSRGLVTSTGTGAASVLASMERSNTGLTDSRVIDPDDASKPALDDPDYDPSADPDYPEEYGTLVSGVTVTSGTNPAVIVLRGSIALDGALKSITPSDTLVVGRSSGVDCVKPTDETYRCEVDPSLVDPVTGLTFAVAVSNYVDTFIQGGTTRIEDNKVCTSPTTPVVTAETVTNDGATNEVTTITVSGIPGTAIGGDEYMMNITIKPGNRSC